MPGHFIFASFASAFLLKVTCSSVLVAIVSSDGVYIKTQLLRPEFVHILTREMEDEIFDSISRLITTLQEVAIDERHTPRLYARFLAGLLTKHRKGGGSSVAGRMQPRPAAGQLVTQTQTQPQPQSYAGGGSRGSSSLDGHHAGMQAPSGSEARGENDGMQMNMKMGVLPNGVESPVLSGSADTVHQPQSQVDVASSYNHLGAVLNSGGSGSLVENNDVSMADVLADSGTLATMHALNDVWWDNMMMPGCVFFFPKTRIFFTHTT